LTTFSVEANSSIYEPLVPPKAEDIVAFTNGLPPSTGLRKMVKRDTVLRFLRRGKNNLNVSSWYDLEYPDRDRRIELIQDCDGVMVDKNGQFIFWFLRTPKVLKLETPESKTALLQLP
jgi:hypothetical protein